MNTRNVQILDQIRAEALEREIPAPDVEQWLALARPCALLDSLVTRCGATSRSELVAAALEHAYPAVTADAPTTETPT